MRMQALIWLMDRRPSLKIRSETVQRSRTKFVRDCRKSWETAE